MNPPGIRAPCRCNYATSLSRNDVSGPEGNRCAPAGGQPPTRGEANPPAAPGFGPDATTPFPKTPAASAAPRPIRGIGTDRQIRPGRPAQTTKTHVNSVVRPKADARPGAASSQSGSDTRATSIRLKGPETNAARLGEESGDQRVSGQFEVSVMFWSDHPMIPPTPQSRQEGLRMKVAKL